MKTVRTIASLRENLRGWRGFGETVALVGANGAGKTTFLRAVSGVQPMSAGSVHFDGEDISRLRSDMRMRRGICQSPEGRQVFGPLTIEDNLRLGAYTQPRSQVEGDLEKVFAMFPILKEKRKLPAGTLFKVDEYDGYESIETRDGIDWAVA